MTGIVYEIGTQLYSRNAKISDEDSDGAEGEMEEKGSGGRQPDLVGGRARQQSAWRRQRSTVANQGGVSTGV